MIHVKHLFHRWPSPKISSLSIPSQRTPSTKLDPLGGRGGKGGMGEGTWNFPCLTLVTKWSTLFSHNHLFCSRSASASRDWDECTDDVELSSRNDEGDCWIARAGVISLRMNVNLKKKKILKYNFWLFILDSQWNTKAHCVIAKKMMVHLFRYNPCYSIRP